jgi:hypothetical protein
VALGVGDLLGQTIEVVAKVADSMTASPCSTHSTSHSLVCL